MPPRILAGSLALVCALVPARASAQWSVTVLTGTVYTRPSSITIDRPAAIQSLTFENVRFDAKPFEDAPYYGLRVARFGGERRRFGVEIELLHSKVYARTTDTVQVRGTVAGAPVDAVLPMNVYVQRYNHTHGLNFLLANLVWRRPLGNDQARVVVMVRGGAGPVWTGRDIVMPDLNVQGYEITGLGAQAAAGVSVRLSRLFSGMAEYKFTYTRPEIELGPGGRGRIAAAAGHHIVAGLAIGK